MVVMSLGTEAHILWWCHTTTNDTAHSWVHFLQFYVKTPTYAPVFMSRPLGFSTCGHKKVPMLWKWVQYTRFWVWKAASGQGLLCSAAKFRNVIRSCDLPGLWGPVKACSNSLQVILQRSMRPFRVKQESGCRVSVQPLHTDDEIIWGRGTIMRLQLRLIQINTV